MELLCVGVGGGGGGGGGGREEQSQDMYTATVQFAVMAVKSPRGTFSKSAYLRIMCPSCGDPDCQAAWQPCTQTLAKSATFKIQK